MPSAQWAWAAKSDWSAPYFSKNYNSHYGIGGKFDCNLIFIGWKRKANTGIVAMALTLIIGVTMCGLSVSKIIGFWPNSIVFYLISIGLFFNYAVENGTLDLLGKKCFAP